VGASLSLLFMVTEALVGAGLVLFNLVAGNASAARAISVSIHLVNTFLLLASLTLTAHWAAGGAPVKVRGQGLLAWTLAAGIVGMLILGVSGALTALGDTLFKAHTLTEGISQDFAPTAHFLIRLRLFHPLIAVATSALLIVVGGLTQMLRPGPARRRPARIIAILALIQLGAGALNVILLAPVWLQLLHLLLADLVWVTFILLAASALAPLAADDVPLPIPASAPLGQGA
jgi:heme A synthase